MKVIYIAGPFRGKNAWEIEKNIRRAEAFALAVWRLGYAAICPHANTRFFDGVLPNDVWLTGDLEIVRRCDGLLTTPNWKQSVGATAEVKFAEDNDIPVFFSLAELVNFFPTE